VTCAELGCFEVWSDSRRGNGSSPQETNRKEVSYGLISWSVAVRKCGCGRISPLGPKYINRSANSLNLLVKGSYFDEEFCVLLLPFNNFNVS
jgi:hypothetical protein